MVVGGSQQDTLDPGFVLLGTRQQGVPVIISWLTWDRIRQGEPVPHHLKFINTCLILACVKYHYYGLITVEPDDEVIENNCSPKYS
ncbi:unnamed protein product [Schistosoma curassoni]|uniref:Uncharacterized protein n=1 Tax=Schistosoma curassoni TaxID=6186 RepID=A0A183KLK8_9TREM|nr:unnamed protein product [Schistosoma curassoni]